MVSENSQTGISLSPCSQEVYQNGVAICRIIASPLRVEELVNKLRDDVPGVKFGWHWENSRRDIAVLKFLGPDHLKDLVEYHCKERGRYFLGRILDPL